MSRDSSATHLHFASSRFADLFEEFCRPPSTGNGNNNTTTNANSSSLPAQQQPPPTNNGTTAPGPINDGSGMTTLPGSFLPFEEIHLPPHLMPLNPEDEDGVVPDMHAAFGINRALGQGHGSGNGGAGGGGLGGNAAGAAEGSGSGGPGGEASLAGVQREPVWRDLGLQGLMADVSVDGRKPKPGGSRREGKRTGLLFLR